MQFGAAFVQSCSAPPCERNRASAARVRSAQGRRCLYFELRKVGATGLLVDEEPFPRSWVFSKCQRGSQTTRVVCQAYVITAFLGGLRVPDEADGGGPGALLDDGADDLGATTRAVRGRGPVATDLPAVDRVKACRLCAALLVDRSRRLVAVVVVFDAHPCAPATRRNLHDARVVVRLLVGIESVVRPQSAQPLGTVWAWRTRC